MPGPSAQRGPGLGELWSVSVPDREPRLWVFTEPRWGAREAVPQNPDRGRGLWVLTHPSARELSGWLS